MVIAELSLLHQCTLQEQVASARTSDHKCGYKGLCCGGIIWKDKVDKEEKPPLKPHGA